MKKMDENGNSYPRMLTAFFSKCSGFCVSAFVTEANFVLQVEIVMI